MFQSFSDTADPSNGPARLQDLRAAMANAGLNGFIIPRADAHQGEYVAPADERLAWLTGFAGSAGFCIALEQVAGVFIDGRYRVQVKDQIDLDHFTPVHWPEIRPAKWLADNLTTGTIDFDPWLHTPKEIDAIQKGLQGTQITLQPTENIIDQIWSDRPAPPIGPVRIYPDDLAGESHADKRARLANNLGGAQAAVITLPDSVSWLLNIRGADITRNPVVHSFAILHADAAVDLFIEAQKLPAQITDHFGSTVRCHPVDAFQDALKTLNAATLLDYSSVPVWVTHQLDAEQIIWGDDPCVLPKACKNNAEITASRAAHIRDGTAVCEFLSWYDTQIPGTITEIDVVTKLEECRRATNALLDISFDTIAGAGPHGAIAHYRVSEASNRTLQQGDLLVLDGGGQYLDGTTDITRTLPMGAPGGEERQCFTRVLQGMIAMSRVRWPHGLAGRDLDAIARAPLWMAGQDYDHGTGHGVGVNLCVHEGPQRLSKVSNVPLQPGMILSNEPGYYREGAFGIRIENLVVVQPAPNLPDGDKRDHLHFETISFAPIDQRLIDPNMLTKAEKDWLNAYHAECVEKLSPHLSGPAQNWLQKACAPL